MNSREAFEAHILRTTCEKPYLVGGAYNNVGWRKSWEDWQAAIQHASDVAVKVCEKNKRINLGVDYPEDAGYNLAIRVCVDAIKKKLHSRAATPGNKGTTPNS